MTDLDIQDQKGWRGSREVWLDAARAALLDGGVGAVKVQPLASALNLSRTSFYWFFKDRGALLDALLDDWGETNTAALLEGCSAYAETIAEAVLNLLSVFLDENRFQPRYEMAVRGWAHESDAVAARLAEADEQRLTAIRGMFDRFGYAPEDADVRARVIYLVQIGYISMQTRETLATRMARIPAYVRTYAGEAAKDAELARFQARHEVHSMADRAD